MSGFSTKVVEIPAGAHYEMVMQQGQANIFYVINYSESDIYIRMNGVARTDQYDRIIQKHTSDIFGRPLQVGRVDYYNPSDTNAVIEVQYTYDEDFDYSILKNTSGGAAAGGGSAGASGEVTITNVLSGVTMQVSDAITHDKLTQIKSTLDTQASTNSTILEGINAILASL